MHETKLRGEAGLLYKPRTHQYIKATEMEGSTRQNVWREKRDKVWTLGHSALWWLGKGGESASKRNWEGESREETVMFPRAEWKCFEKTGVISCDPCSWESTLGLAKWRSVQIWRDPLSIIVSMEWWKQSLVVCFLVEMENEVGTVKWTTLWKDFTRQWSWEIECS